MSLRDYPSHVSITPGSGSWSWRCCRCQERGSGNLAQADRFAYSHRCESNA